MNVVSIHAKDAFNDIVVAPFPITKLRKFWGPFFVDSFLFMYNQETCLTPLSLLWKSSRQMSLAYFTTIVKWITQSTFELEDVQYALHQIDQTHILQDGSPLMSFNAKEGKVGILC